MLMFRFVLKIVLSISIKIYFLGEMPDHPLCYTVYDYDAETIASPSLVIGANTLLL